MCRVDAPRGTLAAAASASAAASTTFGAVTPFPLHGAVGHEPVLPNAMPPQEHDTARAWANPVTGRESGTSSGKDGSRSAAGGALTSPAASSPIGTKGGPQFAWTPEAEALALRMRADDATYLEIGRAVGRSHGAVREKLQQLRERGVEVAPRPPGRRPSVTPEAFEREGQPWAAEEIDVAIEMRGGHATDGTIAGALGRSVRDVREMLARLKRDVPGCTPIRRDAIWGEYIEEIRILADKGLSDAAIAVRLRGALTPEQVRHARRRTGIPAGVACNRPPQQPTTTLRACLGRGCRDKPHAERLFPSEGPGHRVCDSCAKLQEHAA